MHDRIQALLERELQKLEVKSQSTPEPLSIADVKCLDVLIKAHRTFSDPTKDPTKQLPSPDGAPPPQEQSLESLLDDVQIAQHQGRI